jgi:hypothetical protein
MLEAGVFLSLDLLLLKATLSTASVTAITSETRVQARFPNTHPARTTAATADLLQFTLRAMSPTEAEPCNCKILARTSVVSGFLVGRVGLEGGILFFPCTLIWPVKTWSCNVVTQMSLRKHLIHIRFGNDSVCSESKRRAAIATWRAQQFQKFVTPFFFF